MIEDKLTPDQRLRLECLAQANASTDGRLMGADTIVSKAAVFERYVREGKGEKD